jgi:hypothetical protein
MKPQCRSFKTGLKVSLLTFILGSYANVEGFFKTINSRDNPIEDI